MRPKGAIDCGAFMKICKWSKCGKEFEPAKVNQDYCKPECRHAHNNYLKITGIHLCPRALYYVQSLAEARKITNDEMANEMILKISNSGQENLTNEEAAGLREVKEL